MTIYMCMKMTIYEYITISQSDDLQLYIACYHVGALILTRWNCIITSVSQGHFYFSTGAVNWSYDLLSMTKHWSTIATISGGEIKSSESNMIIYLLLCHQKCIFPLMISIPFVGQDIQDGLLNRSFNLVEKEISNKCCDL